MTAAHPIAAGSPATKSVRRVLVDAIQAATGCCRSEAGQVVGDTVWLGLLTDQSVELYERAIDLTPGLTPCPRCMAPRRSGTSGICAGCRATMAERQRERDRGRQPKAMALWPLPEPTTPDPEAAPVTPVLDRFDREEVIAMCSRKRRYVSKIEADRAMRRCIAERPWHRLRVYDCPACKGWHLTRAAAAPPELAGR